MGSTYKLMMINIGPNANNNDFHKEIKLSSLKNELNKKLFRNYLLLKSVHGTER